jgi:anthraniloyl-CoA monooxygenase
VVERNRPYDTFGWGVVFSDQTLGNLRAADPVTATQILDAFNHWDDIEINIKGRQVRSSGHGFCGIGRKRLLNILQDAAWQLGVQLVFETDVVDDAGLSRRRPDHRQRRPEQPHPHQVRRHLPARHRHPAVPLRLAGHAQAVRRLHLRLRTDRTRLVPGARLPFDDTTSTFIVETPEPVWQALGFETMDKDVAIAFWRSCSPPTWTATR